MVVARLRHDIVGILDDGEQTSGGLHLLLPVIGAESGIGGRQMPRQPFQKIALLQVLMNAGRTALCPERDAGAAKGTSRRIDR